LVLAVGEKTVTYVLPVTDVFQGSGQRSRYSAWGTGWKRWGSNPGRGRVSSYLLNAQTDPKVQATPVQRVPYFLSGIKRLGREVDLPPPSSAEVKNVKPYFCSSSKSSWRGRAQI
jgi:hypothetical protein